MGLSTRRWASPPFRTNVGVRSDGEVAANISQRVTHRMTALMGVQTDGRVHSIGMVAEGGRTSGTSTVTVASNTFDGITALVVGSYRFVAGVDFVVGASTDATATNIGAALAVVKEIGVSVVGSVVTITWPGQGKVVFRAENFGSEVCLTLSPTTGYLSEATPGLGAPVFTD